MSERRRAILLYLIKGFKRKVGREITLTRLMKLLYLVDRELAKRGLSTSDTKWIRWYYGPYSEEVERELISLVREKKVKRDFVVLGRDAPILKIFDTDVQAELDENTAKAVDDVLDEYAELNFDELLGRVYETFNSNLELGEKIHVISTD
ncbi:MAG: hypothetical protein DRN78_05510 [Thermoproteota archaeon]|nr:MAG: hypothetical protein DRN78_05510 [Candidatus Korarchaeota archaeon]